MTLQARLTLWSILAMATIVTVVSVSDLIGEIRGQVKATVDRGRFILSIASHAVSQPSSGAMGPLTEELIRDLIANSQSVAEIAITDKDNRVVVGSTVTPTGEVFPNYPDFEALVAHQNWLKQLNVIASGSAPYQLTRTLRAGNGELVAQVHVVILPEFIRDSVRPILKHHAWVAIISVVGAMLGAFIFSTIAFHPLGKVGKLLDMVASGEYELQQVAKSPADEFGIVASKVSLLGQALRGAQTEFSDLKGNFERLLDELEDAVLIFGRDRRLIAAAGAVESLLGRPRPGLLGQAVNDVFPLGTTMGLLIQQAMQLGRPIRNRSVPVTIEKDGKSRIKVILLTMEFLGETSGMLIRLRDPEATRQIGRQLQTADRLSAISRLTSGVAHEVKNPLNAILMHVELAKIKLAHGDYDLNPQMEVLTNEILRLDRVVKTFLDFTRPVQLNLADVPLADFVNELADLARPQAAANSIEVTVENSTEPVSITIDPDLFKQAVLNIVVNAIEAMPEGGRLGFWSGIVGDQAEIRISDTGSGIADELRDKIYNLYFTTKQQGSGIGLSMTFRIVQLHDGTIDFASEAGKGTTFSLRLPVAVLAA
jgi:hypothetical protein